MKLRILFLGSLVAAGACVPQADPPPPPQPQPRPVQPASRPAPPQPAPADWRDIPLSQGDWYYNNQPNGSQALFGPANSEAAFVVRCDRARRQIVLSREGATSGNAMTIRTTSGARTYPLSVQTEPLQYVFATTGASDPFLDEMVFSRGRFTVQVPGTPMLALPAWPEPARVIEDCRG